MLSVVLAALLSAGAAAATPEAAGTVLEPLPERIDLYAGDSRVLRFPARRVAVGNGRVVSVSTLDATQLLLQAEAPGTTTLQLWPKEGRPRQLTVNVSELNLDIKLEQVRKLLEGTRSVTARIAGNRIVLEGSQVSDAEQERAAAVTATSGGVVLNFIGKLAWEQMISLEVRIVEFRRNSVGELGIRWDASANGPNVAVAADFVTNPYYRLQPTPDQSGGVPLLSGRVWPPAIYAGWTSALASRINLLAQRGDALILAEPMLSCRSGGSAHFVSGGEVPIPTIDRLGATDVQFKEYGIILDVKPRADADGAIYAEIDTEISQIDESLRVLGVPGFLKRKSTTAVNVRAGETIVIAGLVSRLRSRDRQAVPGLGAVPGVGAMFRTRSERRQSSELVIFITPRTVHATPTSPADASADNARAIESARARVEAVSAEDKAAAPKRP